MGCLAGARRRASCVCRGFCASIAQAGALGRFKVRVLTAAAGGGGTAGEDNSRPGHSVVCTAQGVFTFGSSQHGQLGHEAGDELETSPRMCAVLAGQQAVSVSAGQSHTIVATRKGEAYSFGCGRHGVLGHGDMEDLGLPRLIASVSKVVHVAAGSQHTLLCTLDGGLYSFGCGDDGKLGHGGVDSVWAPKLVAGMGNNKVLGVAAGHTHSVVCTDTGGLYTFGAYTVGNSGVVNLLGLPLDVAVATAPRLVESLHAQTVTQVAAGCQHTAVCTAEGALYTFGCGDHGRLGHGGRGDEVLPRVVEALLGVRVVHVAAGRGHTVLCTDTGEAYSFGRGSCGQLGHGGLHVEGVPRQISGLHKVSGVAADSSANHSIVWTQSGRVYSFGHGAAGQLGHASGSDELVPRALPVHALETD
eukprot:TRINITY_DN5936_c0_g1_i2.p1 TRINITY_DN5936_c0_g1~~TRINITY_DN5936_c0_g1_i2.p1  ORF type:complete len:416 (+),score=81.83 TRINITY_DN5936_c0_g1_i2:217-1464(+)